MNNLTKILFINIFALFLVVIDQLSKFYMLKNFGKFRNFSILNIVNIKINKNYDLAMSIKTSHILLYFLIIFSLTFLLIILLKNYQQKNIKNVFALIIILAGAIANFTDRLIFGYVIDFINIPFFTTFNLADIYITFGVFYLIIKELAIF